MQKHTYTHRDTNINHRFNFHMIQYYQIHASERNATQNSSFIQKLPK